MCEELSPQAFLGICDLASTDCQLCGKLAPVCTFCADPEEPSAGRCVPIAMSTEVRALQPLTTVTLKVCACSDTRLQPLLADYVCAVPTPLRFSRGLG